MWWAVLYEATSCFLAQQKDILIILFIYWYAQHIFIVMLACQQGRVWEWQHVCGYLHHLAFCHLKLNLFYLDVNTIYLFCFTTGVFCLDINMTSVFENDVSSFSLMVTATADNCLLTCYPFLALHRDDHKIVCEQVKLFLKTQNT